MKVLAVLVAVIAVAVALTQPEDSPISAGPAMVDEDIPISVGPALVEEDAPITVNVPLPGVPGINLPEFNIRVNFESEVEPSEVIVVDDIEAQPMSDNDDDFVPDPDLYY